MEAGSICSMTTGMLCAPPLESERQESNIIRDYCKNYDWWITQVQEQSDWHRPKIDIYNFGVIFLELFSGRKNRRNTIILDSGATMHITGNFKLLSEFARTEDLVYGRRDGTDLHIAGIGTITCDKLHIRNVRYSPQLGSESTIVSVQQLASSGYVVMFCGGWCYVKGHGDGSLVGKGRLHDDDGLYHLEYLHVPDGVAELQSAAG